ncbi:MAG: glycosyltransferase family 2 protein [Candidatus Aegiribacteria sp.]|nr:glycosyltransferase family 2 protein [Candidatus Aegiribacteria sp.]
MKPEISLQIPVKDGGDDFRECLGSLRKQDTGGIPWELIIIDDGSRIPVEDDFDLSFPDTVRIEIIRMKSGGNRPIARNTGWHAATAPVSFLSDADIRFPEDILLKHIERHRRNSGDVIMGTRTNSWMEDASPWQRWFDTRGMGGRAAGLFPPKYFVTGNVSLKTSLLRQTGGFDPAIDRYGGEDTEFGFRLARKGVSLYWDPDLKVYHLDTVTVRDHSRKMVEYGGSGLKYTLGKIPEAEGLLGSSWINPVFSKPSNPAAVAMRVLVKLALLHPVYRCVLRWMEKFGKPVFLFTYLSVGGCLLGLSGRNFE